MRLSSKPIRAGVRGIVLLGLMLGGGNACWAQAELPPPAAEAPAPTVESLEPTTAAPCWPGDCPKEENPWAKVPPRFYWPVLGWAFIRPDTPGYYSLKDVLTDTWSQKRPRTPWPPFGLDIVPMFEADFHPLDDPNSYQHDPIFDATKRLHPWPDWMFSVGGEERIRYANEMDSRLSGKDNAYEVERSRVYGDLWYRDLFRVYVEFLSADSSPQSLPPLSIDVDRADFLNAFVELKLGEIADNAVYARVGRQELIYGSERLITTKDWANVLQTFQGVKTYYRSEKLDVDAFYVQPVIPNPSGLSSVDDHQGFAGLWGTYRPDKDQVEDLYVLNLENGNPAKTLATPGGRGGYDVTTFGARSYGQKWGILWDFEGMYQLGEYTNQAIAADAYVTGIGYHFAELPMNPSFWLYDEFASGSHHPGTGEYGTFNQLFPFGHYYFGWIDDVGRQNINDLNMELQLYPTDWITLLLQYHMFRLDSATDALYNAAGVAIRRDPTGRAGTDVGDEIDLIVNFHLSMHQDILLGYSTLYAGDFIKRTGPGGSPDLFYLQYSFRW
jgi:hypothetical protein